MIDPRTPLSRRRFVQATAQVGAVASLAPLSWLLAADSATASEADSFIRHSQPLPTPRVVLPTETD